MCMKKFFTSDKFGIKNKKLASILDALLGWSFFVISCCAALFVCFYASDSNDVAYAIPSSSEVVIRFLGGKCYEGNKHNAIIKDRISEYSFEGGRDDVSCLEFERVVNKGGDLTITCTLKTEWKLDESKGDNTVEVFGVGIGAPCTYEYEKSTINDGNTQIKIKLKNITDTASVTFWVTPVKYRVKFKSDIADFNNATTGVIQDYVASIACTGKNDSLEFNNKEIYFKYGLYKSFKYTITLGSEYRIIPGSSIQTSANNNNITITPDTDNSESFSITFNDVAMQQYKNSDIEILVTGIMEQKSIMKIETDRSENKSEPCIDEVTVKFSDSDETTFDLEDGFYTTIGPKKDYTATLTIKSKQGYVFKKKDDENSVIKVKYFPESVRNNEDRWWTFKPEITGGENHSKQEFTITLDVNEDMVIRIYDIMFDEYKVCIVSDDSKYNTGDGFLKLYKETEGKKDGCVDISWDVKDKLKQDDLKNLNLKFETPVSFEITPRGKYSWSNISAFLNFVEGDQEKEEKEEKISLEEKFNTDGLKSYRGELKLDSSNIEKFYNTTDGCIKIVVKGICRNFVDIYFTSGGLSKKISSFDCMGSDDAEWIKSTSVGGQYVIKDVGVGDSGTATIKVRLDQWYEFISEDNCKSLLMNLTPGVTFEFQGLEKREYKDELGKKLSGYNEWYQKENLKSVAIFKMNVPKDGRDKKLFVMLNAARNDIIKGYNDCTIDFTNEEAGLTFTKVDLDQDKKVNLTESLITDKTFSNIEFGKPNYFLVKTDDFRCSLGENLVANTRFAECYFVNDAVIENGSGDPKNQRIICVTINDNSDNYYPKIHAEVNLSGVIVEDRFAIIEGINIETLRESDVTESKKIEHGVKFAGRMLTKITANYNAPLSFLIRPAAGYSFLENEGGNVLKINKIIKDGTGADGEADEELENNYTDEKDLSDDDNFTIENLGNSIEIKVKNMLDSIYIYVSSTPDKIPINFNQSEGIEYFKLGKDEKISEPLRGTVTVEKGSGYKFAVKISDGYDPQSLKVLSSSGNLSNSNTFEQEGVTYYIYNLLGVEQYTTITTSVEKLKCKLIFTKPPVGSYYTRAGSDTEITEQFTEDGILYGSNFSFCVKLKDEYSQSKLTVKVDGSEIQPLSGDTYTIYNITKDGTISIDDSIKLNNYTVNFESSDRAEYILEGNGGKIKNVEYGNNCKFKVRAKTGYILGENIAVNCVGDSGSETLTGKKVSGSGSGAVYEYEIENITENKTISVSGVEDLFYNIKLQDVEGVTYINDTGAVISGNHKIAYGKNFEFSVNVDDAYDDSIPGMFIVVNEGKSIDVSAQKLSSGKYVIPNVTQDITIRVGNIRKNRYTVTFTKTEGIDYYDTNGKIITGDIEVEQNGSISFKVSLYRAYSDSKITVMLGDKAVTADSSDIYTISGIDEDKTVTVIGVEKSKEAELINTINSLPNPVKTLDDANLVIEASKIYNSLSEEKKKTVTNYDLLQKLQEQVKAFHHISNDVKIEGVDWYLKLVAVPISSNTEICSRIYKKLNSEYILSLYDVYLWDTLNDRRYTLPSGTTAVVSIPTPDMTYFNKPTGIHENDDGKIDYLSLTFDGGRTTFEAVTFSPFGVIANRSSTPGRSSLLDAVDANVDLIKDFALSSFGGGSSDKSGISESAVFDDTNSDSGLQIGSEDDIEGNISEKYKSRNNKVTARGSALRLILVLMIIVLIALALWILYKRRKEMKKSKKQ